MDDGLFDCSPTSPADAASALSACRPMDDTILKRMKRRHLRADAARVVERARERRPDVVFGADLIAGFPTETEAMFENTLLGRRPGPDAPARVSLFERDGTPAARMPAVARCRPQSRAQNGSAAGDIALEPLCAHKLARRPGA